MQRPPEVRPSTPAMRAILMVASVLVFIIGIPLSLASTATETFFAWTIATPLTAAFLGASYWASGVLEFMASRRSRWCDARIAVPAVLIFTTLTLGVTLLHLDRFHFGAEVPITLAVTWAWLVVYAVVPVLLVAILVLQSRESGVDAPRTRPLRPAIRMMFVAQGLVMAGFGAALLVAPVATAALWPWALTPLTGRAIGVWLLSLGIAALHVAYEDDLDRIRPAAVSYVVLTLLQFLALARFPGDVAWDGPAAWIYVLFLAWMLGLGLVLNRATTGARRARDGAGAAGGGRL